jgi:hypothetical protein
MSTEKNNVEKTWDVSSRTPMLVAELSDRAGITPQAVRAALKKLVTAGALKVSEFDPKMFLRVKGVRSCPADLKTPAAPSKRRSRAQEAGGTEFLSANAPVDRAQQKLETMTKPELRAVLADLGLTATSKTTAPQLRALIEAHRSNRPAADTVLVEGDPVAERAAVLAKLPKAKLVELVEGLGLSTRPSQTRQQLAELAAVRESQQAPADPGTAVDTDTVQERAAVLAKLPKAQRLVMAFVDERGYVDRQMIANANGSSPDAPAVTSVLKALVRRGLIVEPDTTYGRYVLPAAPADPGTAVIVDGVTLGGSANVAAVPAESDAEPPNDADGIWGTPEAVDAPEGSLEAVLADLRSVRPVSAPPAPTPRVGGQRKEAGGVIAVKGNKATQWQRGQLNSAITEVLFLLDDGTATDVTRALNLRRADDTAPIAQAGAVKYALEKLVDSGYARRTSEAPKRYARAV